MDHGSMFVRIGTCHAVPCLFVLAPAILSQLTASCLPIFNEILIPFFCGVDAGSKCGIIAQEWEETC